MFNGVPTEGLPSNADSNKDSLVSIDRDIDITEDTVFLLRATRDLQEGEEVTICYDQVVSCHVMSTTVLVLHLPAEFFHFLWYDIHLLSLNIIYSNIIMLYSMHADLYK